MQSPINKCSKLKYLFSKQKKQEIQSVKGMKDIHSENLKFHQHITNTLKSMANQNNYEEVFLNQLESIEVFKRTLGDQSDIVKKEMFSLQDLGGNTLVLRPEGTASLMRFILNNKLQFNLPKKYFYYGPMYRYERPQKGRYRQFYQFGVENLGSNDPLADFEIVNMANQIMQKIYQKSENFELEINTLGDLEAQNFYNLELQKFFKQKNIYVQLSEDSKQRLERNNALRILDSKNQKDIELSENAPKIQQFLSQSSQENYQEIKQMLQISGISYTENFRLVRGLDYYNDLCFEFKDKSQGGKSQNTLLAGGRYDRLSSILSQNQTNISAVGWAAGIDRMSEKLMELVDINNLPQKKVIKIGFVPIIQGKDISSEDKNIIRSNLLKVHKKMENFIMQKQYPNYEIKLQLIYKQQQKKYLDYLIKNDFDYGIFIGKQEQIDQVFNLKNLKTQEQKSISFEQDIDLNIFLN